MKTKWYLPHLIFILAGVVLFIAAFKILPGDGKPEDVKLWSDITKDFAVVITSLAVTDIVWKIVGGDPISAELTRLKDAVSDQVRQLRIVNAVSQAANESGLVFISSKPMYGAEQWKELLLRSQRNIDISALTLMEIVDDAELMRALRDRIGAGVPVRILLNDPNVNTLQQIGEFHPPTIALIQMALVKLSNLGKEINRAMDVTKTFRIRLLQTKVLQIAIRRFDDTISVMPYLQSQTSPTTPMFVIEGPQKPLFITYNEEFQYLFDKALDFDWKSAP